MQFNWLNEFQSKQKKTEPRFCLFQSLYNDSSYADDQSIYQNIDLHTFYPNLPQFFSLDVLPIPGFKLLVGSFF